LPTFAPVKTGRSYICHDSNHRVIPNPFSCHRSGAMLLGSRLTLSRGARLVDHHFALQVLKLFAGPDVSAPDAMARATPAAFA